MAGYTTLLCCTDFSENADHAFDEACYIASLTGARLHLLHVIHAGTGEAALAVPAWQREAEEAALLARLEDTYRPRAVGDLEVAVATGDVTTEILEYAREIGAGLIVIGARWLSRLEGFLSGGSVAEHVVRAASTPVLVVNVKKQAERKPGSEASDADAGSVPLIVKEVWEAQDSERAARAREAGE